jgi:hypothetical protein
MTGKNHIMKLNRVLDASADRLSGAVIALAIISILILPVSCGRTSETDSGGQATESASGDQAKISAGDEADFQTLVGRWVRPDGGYIIEIRGIGPGGRLEAGYFNPGEINVARAEASLEAGTVNLFIELRDRGYPGSTYDLIYDEQEDILIGVYFQAVLQQKFNVLFVRMQAR